MNIFILNSGRCGSTTFIKACEHITNFSAEHESRSGLLGDAHFDYPENHIEADNRLSWFLGRLDRHYGNRAFYVHLRRNDNDTAHSFAKRYSKGIIKAYRKKILAGLSGKSDPIDVCLDYCETVNSNIMLFLKDKTQKMEFDLGTATQDFIKFWEVIGAEGDLELAVSEFGKHYNASEKLEANDPAKTPVLARILQKFR
jgi:hypothetical protein